MTFWIIFFLWLNKKNKDGSKEMEEKMSLKVMNESECLTVSHYSQILQ